MLDAVESELPGHVEETEFQVSFSVGSPRTASESGQLRLDVDVVPLGQITRCAAREERFPAGWTVSGRDVYSNDSVAGRERTAMAKTFTTARASRRM